MDTAELLRKAWQAVIESGVPAEVQGVALRIAADDVRAKVGPTPSRGSRADDEKPAKKRPRMSGAPTAPASDGDAQSILSNLGETDRLFAAIAHETEVDEQDLRDVFHVEGGVLELKVPGKDLGDSVKAKAMTITALLGGVVFGGTSQTRLPFKEIHAVCKQKRCYDRGNGSANVKATPGFAAVGSGADQALTHKRGWETSFADAVARALGRAGDS
jgi:hypothetical protein